MSSHRDSGWRRWYARLSIVVIAGAALRLPEFTTSIAGVRVGKVLWFDEAYSWFMASRGVVDAVRLSFFDSSPGLFAALLSLWTFAFGDSTAVLAALPFLLSAAGIAAAGFAAAEMFGPRAGLIAAAIVAVNPLHVRYATEVRTYSLLFLLGMLSIILLRRFQRGHRVADGAGWLAIALLGLYAHYTFIALLVPQVVWTAWRLRPARRELRRFFFLVLGLALGYLPQVLSFKRWSDFFPQDGATSNFVKGFSRGDATSAFTFFSTLAFGERPFYARTVPGAMLAAALGGIVAALFLRAVWRRRDDAVRFLGACLFGGIVALILANFIYAPRYYLLFLGPASLILAAEIAARSRRQAVVILAAVALVMAVPLAQSFAVPPAEAFKYYGPSFAAAIQRGEHPGDLVLVDHYSDMVFRRYYQGRSDVKLFFPKYGGNVTDMYERFRWFDYDFISEGDRPGFEELLRGHDRVWTVDYEPQSSSLQDPDGLKRRWLDERFDLAGQLEFPAGDVGPEIQKTVLSLYERR